MVSQRNLLGSSGDWKISNIFLQCKGDLLRFCTHYPPPHPQPIPIQIIEDTDDWQNIRKYANESIIT
jgi:hypothetical protein